MLHLKAIFVEKLVFQRGVEMREAAGHRTSGDADAHRPFTRPRQVRIKLRDSRTAENRDER